MKWRFWAGTLISTTIIAFAGAVSGTLAWYEYVTRASVSYEGTSIFNTQQLQIGLRTNHIELLSNRNNYETVDENAPIRHYTLKEESADIFDEIIDVDTNLDGIYDYSYYFVSPGGSLSPNIINNYLNKTVNNIKRDLDGVHLLSPITSKAHGLTNQISSWYKSPVAYRNEFVDTIGNEYADIHLAFRVISSSTSRFLKNQDIWLKDALCQTSGEASDAMRLYFEGERKTTTGRENTHVLFNPNYDGISSYDVTAGVLDLNGDGYYDCTNEPFYNSSEEIVYGLDSYSTTHRISESDYDGINEWELNNINNYEYVSSTSPLNTFYAKHRQGVLGYLNYQQFDMPKSYYYGTQAVYPENEQGALSGGIVLTSTSDDDLSIAELSMKVYLEGWNHSIIDKNLNYLYNLGLTFQINKVA